MEATQNLLPGTCRCGAQVASRSGVWIKSQTRLLCTSCYAKEAKLSAARPKKVFTKEQPGSNKVRLFWAPRQKLVIARALDVSQRVTSLVKEACKRAGCHYDATRGNHGPFEQVTLIVRELEAEGLKVDLAPELVAEVEREAAKVRRLAALGAMRAERFAKLVKERTGKTVRGYQKVGIQFLASHPCAVLADDGGCIDGDAMVTISRAGITRNVTLAHLFHKFNGGSSRGHRWDPGIPTYIRSLTGEGYFKRNLVKKVLDKGVQKVVKLTLKSGKSLRLTPDHEVCVHGSLAFKRVESLKPGDVVLTNGARACPRCGGSEDLILYRWAKFYGYCRTCMYRQMRSNGRAKAGHSITKDGYVEITSGMKYHPAVAAKTGRNGRLSAKGVLEHRLVVEAAMNDLPLKAWIKICRANAFRSDHQFLSEDLVVHHKNGNKRDNRLSNLEVQTKSEHAAEHGGELGFLRLDGATSGKGGAVCFLPQTDEVVAVAPDGEAHVYDVVCDDPWRNFVANKIVVHNCGKSLQVLGALGPNPRCLVVAPAIMRGAYVGRGSNKTPRGGWADEARKWLPPDVKVTILSGRGSFRWPEPNEIVITGYDVLPRAVGENGKNAPPPPPPCPSGVTVVADEAQNLTNGASLRTQRFQNVARRALEAGGCLWGVTATPLNNEPKELWQVFDCFGIARATFGSFENFASLHQCAAKPVGYNRFEIEWGKPVEEVAERLKKYMLRRRKRDVLTELPPIAFESVVVELDKKTIALCDAALSEIEKTGLDLEKAFELLDEARGGLDFTMISKAMEALGRAKLPAALEYVKLYEERKEPVIFFASHVTPVEKVGARKGWGMISGETATANLTGEPKAHKRNEVIRLFQEGQIENGVAATIQSTGTGATLTRASRAFFHSRLWSATKNAQAVWRIERIGQENAMTVTNLIGNHPLDLRHAEVLEKKAELYAASVDAASVEQEDLNKPKLAVAQDLEAITNRAARPDLQRKL